LSDGGGAGGDAEEIAQAVGEELNGVQWHVDTQQVSEELAGELAPLLELDTLPASLATVEERTGRIEQTLEEMQR